MKSLGLINQHFICS